MSTVIDPFVGYRYQLHESLGAGGMGQVLRATDRLTGQPVALKQVRIAPRDLQFTSRPPAPDAASLLLALAHEFRTLASLRHPHIISVLDYGFDAARQPFFTMELLPDAQTMLDAGRNAPPSTQLALLTQLLEALVYLHRRGVLHHDLKPDNVLVADGQVRVLDFGLAVVPEQTRASDSFGSILYLAPEVLNGQPYTVASDLYAVGVLAYEVLVGVHPFAAPTMVAFLDQLAAATPDLTPLADRPALQAVIAQLLAADPRARFASASAARAALRAARGESLAAEDARIRDSFLHAATFVGRTAELTQLRAALAEALAGRGGIWLVGGESGVGKSRLVEELRAEALVAGALVLRGQAVEGGGLPFQLWRAPLRQLVLEAPLSDADAGVLRDLVPDLPRLVGRPIPPAPPLDPQGTWQRLADVIAAAIHRQPRAVVLLADDLQWAAESLTLLQLVQGQLADQALLIIGTYRTDERPDLPAALPGAQVLLLPRLDPAALATLSAAMLGPAGTTPAIVELLARETEGNAFFAVEVVRALAEEAGRLDQVGQATLPTQVVTGGVQRLIVRRLAQVPQAARRLLDYAAVAGRQIDEPVLRALVAAQPALWPTGDVAAWLRTSADAAVLELADSQWRFAHDKLREGLLQQLDPTALPALHRAVAEALEAVYADPAARAPYTEPLREHWQQAGDAARELPYLVAAVQRLIEQNGNFVAAQALSERGLELLATMLVPDAIPVWLTLQTCLAAALLYQGNTAATMAVLTTALARADATTYPAGRLPLLNQRALLHMSRGQLRDALRDSEEGVQLARQLDDRLNLAVTLSRAGIALIWLGDPTRAQAYLDESYALADSIAYPEAQLMVYHGWGMVAFTQRQYPTALTHFLAERQHAQTANAHLMHALALTGIGEVLIKQRAITAETRTLITGGLQLADRLGFPLLVVPMLLNQSALARSTGDWANVAAPLSRARAIVTAYQVQAYLPHSLREAAWQAWQQDDLATARTLAADSVAAAQADGLAFETRESEVLVAILAVAAGDTRAAHTAIARCLMVPEAQNAEVYAIGLRLRGQLQLQAGAVPAAVTDLAASVAHARTSDLPSLVVESLAHLAVAQARAGDPRAAQISLRAAASSARALANLAPLHLHVVLAAAQVAAQSGRITEATRLAHLVVADVHSSCATRTAARALVGDRAPSRRVWDLDALLAQLARG